MAQPVIQTSFHAGEWAPALNARVDLAKYHSAAALLRNFFVDYRGGASSRAGLEYVLQAFKSSTAVRLIGFQASFTVSYVLEFGDRYLRFINNGSYVLENSFAIQATSQANPCQVTLNGNNYAVGDVIFISGIAGMTQLNNKYFIVRTAGNTITLNDLFGNAVNSTSFTAYVSGGSGSRVYTINSPYLATDLQTIKYAQNVSTMVITHPSYVPYILTLISANNWTLAPITFGSTVTAPTITSVTPTGGGTGDLAYIVTAVDLNGQESNVSNIGGVGISITTAVTVLVVWNPVPGAISYNVYRAGPSISNAVPVGSAFGFVTNVTGVQFNDTFFSGTPTFPSNFQETIPIAKNPFQGAGVAFTTVTNQGVYGGGVTINVTFGAAPAGGVTATGFPVFTVLNTAGIPNGGLGYIAGHTIAGPGSSVLLINTVGVGGVITAVTVLNGGSFGGPITPTNPVTVQASPDNPGNPAAQINFTWGIQAVQVIQAGAGYTVAPAIGFSSGAAAATATLLPSTSGNPSVPQFHQQRLTLAGPIGNPQHFDLSQPGSYFNYNVSNPIQEDDAISGTLVSGQLNTIKSMISMQSGLIILSDKQAWLLNGGGSGVAVTPINVSAQSQAYNGASDVPPIVANNDILYVQSKGSIVRDLTFNFYTNIYTGADISVLSSHLFYGKTIVSWAYAEEPFKTIWAVRSDGIALSLTYLKEQELIGWAHSDTKGLFKSVATVTETVLLEDGQSVAVDAAYFCVQRTINGQVLQYIERMAERIFPYGVEDAWCVDAGLQSVPGASNAASLASGITLTFSSAGPGAAIVTASTVLWNANTVGQVIRAGGGIMTVTSIIGVGTVTQCNVNITTAITAITPDDPTNTPLPAVPGSWTIWNNATVFSGLEHLTGQQVTGLADGEVIPPTTVTTLSPGVVGIVLGTPASKVTIGLAYTPQLQTLQIDLGEPTAQGKMKKIPKVTVRVENTLGLSIGGALDTLVDMKDLIVGNVGGATNEVVTNLVTGDAITVIDPRWTVPGQYFIEQDNPFPATILGVIPEITVGDTK